MSVGEFIICMMTLPFWYHVYCGVMEYISRLPGDK